jgi:hypothetical protein
MKYESGGVAFEIEIQERLQSLGWQVERTSTTGDFGADLVARLAGEVLVVQCKDYGSPAGVSAVQEAHYAQAHYRATAALAVARNGFTKAAAKAAATTGVQILRPGDIVSGSWLDRTPQRREIERREWNLYASQAWREYDLALEKHRRDIRKNLLWSKAVMIIGCFAVPGTIFTMRHAFSNQETYLKISSEVGMFLAIVFAPRRAPSSPESPCLPRRGYVLQCGIFTQKLRVDFGREGSVRCPKCRNFTSIKT